MHKIWLTLSETLLTELEQSADEGRDVRPFADEAGQIYGAYEAGYPREEDAAALLDKIRSAPITKDFPYNEPASLEDIKAVLPKERMKNQSSGVNMKTYYNKVYGAWLGRSAGCLLGQPVEGWSSERINGLLKDTDNYPIKKYMASNVGEEIRKKYQIKDEGHVYGSNTINWINNVSFGPEDDDTNYTILYMKTLEQYGRDFTSDDVVMSWLINLPFYKVCTGERVAYRNFVNLIPPPLSGSYNNVYREWVGAQIRADFFGYANPGNPEKAAEYAWRDGRISHTKNGIYGEMFCAAMIAASAACSDIKDIIFSGLGEIPVNSRLTEGIKKVLSWYETGINWEDALDKLHRTYNEKNHHHWCHTISNAMICTIALLWGKCDFEKTIGIAVCAGFDTDCNAATVGSVIGMMLGADKMPSQWIKPLNNKIRSGIDGFEMTEISELAKRTVAVAGK